MAAPVCLIDHSVTTAGIAHPIERGWVEPGIVVELVPGLTAGAVAERAACALLGSIDAAALLTSHAVVSDVALVSRHTGAVALWTSARPDEIEQTVVILDGVSRTAEAIARATIGNFYGIEPTDWDRERDRGDCVVLEDARALQPAESGHLGDLVRAWFILSGSPIPTHLLVAPKGLVEQEPDAVRTVARALQAAIAAGVERRRELRRNLSDDLGLDRDRLVAFQADQVTTLSKAARKAWLDLLRRTERAMKHGVTDEPDVFSAAGREDG